MTDFTELKIDEIINVADEVLRRQVLEKNKECTLVTVKEIKDKFGENAYWAFHEYFLDHKLATWHEKGTDDNDRTLNIYQSGLAELIRLKQFKQNRLLLEDQAKHSKRLSNSTIALAVATAIMAAGTLILAYLQWISKV